MKRGTIHDKAALAVVDARESTALGKALAGGDLTPEQISLLPPQSLYVALQSAGIESCLDVLLYTTTKQYQLLLDLECWSRFDFLGDRFIGWLQLIDSESSLEMFEKLLRSTDPELLALMISRYVEVVTHEEPTDLPPGPQFYTPDRGLTWIYLDLPDPDEHRIFAKFMAYLYQRNPEMFFQLLHSRTGATTLEMEEHCYQARERRLASQGIPSHELSARTNAKLPEQLVRQKLEAAGVKGKGVKKSSSLPAKSAGGLQPFESMLAALGGEASVEEFASVVEELGAIMNAAFIFFGVQLNEQSEVAAMQQRVRGAINIGLERAVEISSGELVAIAEALGMTGLYQFGLTELLELRKLASRIAPDTVAPSSPGSALLQGCTEAFPARVRTFDYRSASWDILSGSADDDDYTAGATGKIEFDPFEHSADVQAAKALLEFLAARR